MWLCSRSSPSLSASQKEIFILRDLRTRMHSFRGFSPSTRLHFCLSNLNGERVLSLDLSLDLSHAAYHPDDVDHDDERGEKSKSKERNHDKVRIYEALKKTTKKR